MTMYVPAIVWVLSALICLYIAKKKGIKITVLKEIAVTLFGPFAIPFVVLAKSNRLDT